MAESFYVAGKPRTGPDPLVVRHPYDGREVGRTSYATREQVDEAVAAARAAFPAPWAATSSVHSMNPYTRGDPGASPGWKYGTSSARTPWRA